MKKNKIIKILIGIPASGKSTWCTNFLRNNQNWVRVNRDSFRLMLRNETVCEPKIENLITKLSNQTIQSALASKLNVIIDNTNLKEKYINQFIDRFKYFADIEYQVFDISLDKALERDKLRNSTVGDDVIKRMYKDYKILMDTFHFQPVKKLKHRPDVRPTYQENIPNCTIFDIDGTIAYMDGRMAYDWDKVDTDSPVDIVIEHIKHHKSLGRKIILLSGRDSVSRKLTEEWLEVYEIEYDELYMRPINDYRKDTVVKKELYEKNIKGKYNVMGVYDDRLQVLEMWHKEGLFTFNVNQGNFEF